MLTMYYDDSCILCTTNAQSVLEKNPNQIRIISVDAGLDELQRFNITRTYAMTYVCVYDDAINIMHTGMQAVRVLSDSASIWFAPILHAPFIKQFSNWGYPILARNRHRFPRWLIRLIYGRVAELSASSCEKGVCSLPPHKR